MSRKTKITIVVVLGALLGVLIGVATTHHTTTTAASTTVSDISATSAPPATQAAAITSESSTIPAAPYAVAPDDHHPNPTLTPGAVFAHVTASDVCVAGYSKTVRSVSTSTKNSVYAEYGITSHPTGAYEIDHLVALELGGSNDISNLWPEPYGGADNAHDKDKIENSLHAEVCSGAITLAEAQHTLVRWDDPNRPWPDPNITP